GSGAATASAADAEKNCGALHDFFKKMMAALSKKFGKASKSKKLPPRDKFIEACKVLPADVVNCMNPQVAMKEQEKCKKAKEKVDPKAIAKFKAIMSGK
ncbi:MAG: hypothetical protein KC503_39195, partial [Myxococcales bacterium]|nr:hypothetical protein [Myxococcales bacterium]